jgi:hypothetical protein
MADENGNPKSLQINGSFPRFIADRDQLAAAQGGTEGKAKLAVGFLMERAM